VVRIFVADDNPTVRHFLRSALEQQHGWKVCDEAKTGSEVLHRVQRTLPDVILLDFQMPELNGLDIARHISRFFPDIPILMVTVHFSKQLTIAARSAGVRGACAKWEVDSIVEGVEALLHHETYFPQMNAVGV
jgi:DNA-binding NarL/FixJ family response regulator